MSLFTIACIEFYLFYVLSCRLIFTLISCFRFASIFFLSSSFPRILSLLPLILSLFPKFYPHFPSANPLSLLFSLTMSPFHHFSCVLYPISFRSLQIFPPPLQLHLLIFPNLPLRTFPLSPHVRSSSESKRRKKTVRFDGNHNQNHINHQSSTGKDSGIDTFTSSEDSNSAQVRKEDD